MVKYIFHTLYSCVFHTLSILTLQGKKMHTYSAIAYAEGGPESRFKILNCSLNLAHALWHAEVHTFVALKTRSTQSTAALYSLL